MTTKRISCAYIYAISNHTTFKGHNDVNKPVRRPYETTTITLSTLLAPERDGADTARKDATANDSAAG